jgi:hypothetical protein
MIDLTALTFLARDLVEATKPRADDSPVVRRVTSLLAAFEGVNAYDPDAIMACWVRDGVYDNPMVGAAQTGFDAVRHCMANLTSGLKASGHRLVVDRVTPGRDVVVAEWHVEPPDGRRGVHVAEFADDGKLCRVTVYPRNN